MNINQIRYAPVYINSQVSQINSSAIKSSAKIQTMPVLDINILQDNIMI